MLRGAEHPQSLNIPSAIKVSKHAGCHTVCPLLFFALLLERRYFGLSRSLETQWQREGIQRVFFPLTFVYLRFWRDLRVHMTPPCDKHPSGNFTPSEDRVRFSIPKTGDILAFAAFSGHDGHLPPVFWQSLSSLCFLCMLRTFWSSLQLACIFGCLDKMHV